MVSIGIVRLTKGFCGSSQNNVDDVELSDILPTRGSRYSEVDLRGGTCRDVGLCDERTFRHKSASVLRLGDVNTGRRATCNG